MPRLNLRPAVSFLLMCLLAGGSGFLLLGQEKPKLRKIPVQKSSPTDGAKMYKQYCATCHGVTGKGDGPAAAALKSQPTDLSTMARRNNGKFPTEAVRAALEGKSSAVAHGSSDMPVWGPLFHQLAAGDQTIVYMRIFNLTKHLESMQVK